MNITQRQMQAFLAVARLRHITRAAEQLHITQAGLSAMLKDMEKQLDCRLFDRTTRSISITDEGQQLLPVALRIVNELQEVRDAIHHVSSRARSVLTVGVTSTIAASVMPEVAQTFTQTHPDVSLRVRDIDRQAIHEGVAAGSLDVGFGAFFKPASGIERRSIAMFHLVHVCARVGKNKTGVKGGELRWCDLDSQPVLTLPAKNPIQELIDEHLYGAGVPEGQRLEFESIQTLLAMAEAGVGTAILPSFVLPATRRYALSLRPLIEPKVPISYFQISKKGRAPLAEVADLAAALGKALTVDPFQ